MSIRVRIFYPADPLGIVPGGIDTFIRGILKWAPDDIVFSLVGMTSDIAARPVGVWSRCRIDRRDFQFLPIVHVRNAGRRSRLPLSLRYVLSALIRRNTLGQGFDVFDFHRLEPALLFRNDPRPKNAFFHQNMDVIRDSSSDIGWRHAPGLYESIERSIVPRLSSIWCVRNDAVATMQSRYSAQKTTIRFVPTWVDTEVFSPAQDVARERHRQRLADQFELDLSAQWIISVGRLDSQKDPELLVAAFARLKSSGRRLNLLMVGDGVLRERTESQVREHGLQAYVRFLGLRSQPELAKALAASDVFALSSAYEGMPMAVLEALGSGLPVATTDVGEVRRVVEPRVNGAIASDRSPESFANCLATVLDHADAYRGAPAVTAIMPFRPSEVLKPVYENYRALGAYLQSKTAG